MPLIDKLCYMVVHEVCSSRWWELVLPFIRMLVNLLAEKEIVSSLAIQVLTASQGRPMMFLDGTTVGYFGGASKYQFGIVALFDASETGSAFTCRRQQMKG